MKRVFTEEHKKKISESCKGKPGVWKGKKMPTETRYKNMKSHLQFKVDLDWLMTFDDIEKLKELNWVFKRERVSKFFDTEKYKKFIEKFYYDEQFNYIYIQWLSDNKPSYGHPSLDHIIPLHHGGTWDLDNLQFLSWAENRAKFSYKPEEWNYIKEKYIFRRSSNE